MSSVALCKIGVRALQEAASRENQGPQAGVTIAQQCGRAPASSARRSPKSGLGGRPSGLSLPRKPTGLEGQSEVQSSSVMPADADLLAGGGKHIRDMYVELKV